MCPSVTGLRPPSSTVKWLVKTYMEEKCLTDISYFMSKHTLNTAISICSSIKTCDILKIKTPKALIFSNACRKPEEYTNSMP